MYLNNFGYICKVTALAGVLLISITLDPQSVFSTPAHPAVHVAWQGHPTARTPLDQKIAAAGFYQIGKDGVLTSRRTLDQIFAQAMTFQYKKDDGGDVWQDPAVTDRIRQGDCEDMAIWLYRELKRSGFSGVRIMVGKFETSDPRFHSWVVCSADGSDDFIVDPALQRRIWKRSQLLPEIYLPLFSFDATGKYIHTES